jgi:hypothetical protein
MGLERAPWASQIFKPSRNRAAHRRVAEYSSQLAGIISPSSCCQNLLDDTPFLYTLLGIGDPCVCWLQTVKRGH